ncbi:MAG: ABC transporter transmembrane domain-containing protein [Mediterraneibacter gnavus]
MMVSISPKLSVIPIILVPLSLLSAAKMMKLSGTYYNRQQQLLGTLNGYIEEIYHGHQVVQTFHYQKRAQAAFEELNEQLCQSAFKAETTAGAVTPITTVVNDVGYVLCAGLGVSVQLQGELQLEMCRPCWNIQESLQNRFLPLQEWLAVLERSSAEESEFLHYWMLKKKFRNQTIA